MSPLKEFLSLSSLKKPGEKLFFLREKFDPFPSGKEKSFLQRPETFLFILYALLTLLMTLFHEVWRDEAQGFLIVRDLSLFQLIKQLRMEVHFPLWYLLIFPFVKLGLPVTGVGLIHWFLALILAWIVLEKFPFRLLTRAAIVFTYPLFFEFSVIARNYTIGFLLAAVLLLLWKNLWDHPYLAACLLSLLLLSDPFFVGPVLGFCLCILRQAVIQNRLKSKEFLIPCVMVFLAALVCFLLLCKQPGTPEAKLFPPHINNAMDLLQKNVSARLLNPFTAAGELFGLPPAALVFLPFLVLFQLRKSKEAMLFFCATFCVTFLAFVLGGFDSMRHAFFFPAGAAASFVLAEWDSPKEEKGVAWYEHLLFPLFFLPVFWSVLFLAGKSVTALKSEILYDFSHGKYAAKFIERNASSLPLFCTDTAYCTPVMAYLPPRKIFSLLSKTSQTFALWKDLPSAEGMDIPDEVVKNLPPGADCGLYLCMVYGLPRKGAPNLFLLYSSLNERAGAWGHPEECYFLLLVVRPEKARFYRERFPLYKPETFSAAQ
ncbi:MAG: hypothetical protein J6331_01475 [Lentisphaeria bacterium]|nr:hypothetical protein [Lentisphaeria bacterium]